MAVNSSTNYSLSDFLKSNLDNVYQPIYKEQVPTFEEDIHQLFSRCISLAKEAIEKNKQQGLECYQLTIKNLVLFHSLKSLLKKISLSNYQIGSLFSVTQNFVDKPCSITPSFFKDTIMAEYSLTFSWSKNNPYICPPVTVIKVSPFQYDPMAQLNFFWQAAQDKIGTDIELKSNDGLSLPVHKWVFCAQSPFFKTMFDSSINGKEQISGIIQTNFDYEILSLFVEFAYKGNLDETLVKNNIQLAIDLLEISHQYPLEKLKTWASVQIQQWLKDNPINEDIFKDLFTVATVYKVDILTYPCLDFALKDETGLFSSLITIDNYQYISTICEKNYEKLLPSLVKQASSLMQEQKKLKTQKN